MLKIVCLILIASTVLARPEPPVNSYIPPSNSYGPPGRSSSANGNTSGQRPPSTYGASEFERNGQDSNSAGVPSGAYGVPAPNGSGGRPSPAYGTPGRNGNSEGTGERSSSTYGSGGERPSTIYGNPSQNGKGSSGERPSTSYGVPGQIGNGGSDSISGRPSDTYGAPINGNGARKRPLNSYGPPSDSYGPPASGNGARNGGNGNRRVGSTGPTEKYGAPGAGPSSEYLAQNQVHNEGNKGLHSSGNGGRLADEGYDYSQGSSANGDTGDDNGSNEQAKYGFSYEVEDAPSGLFFGHSEKRDGDFTIGQYNVLLPDGRKQIVEYEADQGGYRPQIRYEGGTSSDSLNERNRDDGNGDTNGYDYNQRSGSNGGGNGDGYTSSGQDLNLSQGPPNKRRNGNGSLHNGGSSRGQNLEGNGYSSGQPNGQTLGMNGYSGGQPAAGQFSSKERGYSNGQDNNGNGYSNGRPANGNGKRIGGTGGGGRSGNDSNGSSYNQVVTNGFGVGGQNGENDGNGYQY